jgi:putative transcriptional regulator
MSNKAFDKVAKGLREALSIARGDTKPARLHIPAEIDVRYIRNKLRFLKMILRQRSVLRSIISRSLGGVRTYLMLIERDPGTVIAMLRPLREARKAV